jgi:hypothetical protein
MRSFVLLLALVGACFASPYYSHHTPLETRAGCPPEGYVALDARFRLDNLPAYRKYAICSPLDDDEFVVNKGVFKLSHSQLVVDSNVEIKVEYPGRIDFNDVFVDQIDSTFGGISLYGAPADLHPSPHNDYLLSPRFGNCGSLVNVRIANSNEDLSLTNCSGGTTLKSLRIFEQGVSVEDSSRLVFQDLVVINDVITVDHSQAAFINPTVHGDEDAFEVRDGSRVTICDGFFHGAIQLGSSSDEDGAPVTVGVAGKTNAKFPDDIDYFGQGGILFTLHKCPSPLSASYDSRLWIANYPGNGDP